MPSDLEKIGVLAVAAHIAHSAWVQARRRSKTGEEYDAACEAHYRAHRALEEAIAATLNAESPSPEHMPTAWQPEGDPASPSHRR